MSTHFVVPSKQRTEIIGTAVEFIGTKDLYVLVDEAEKADYQKVLPKGIVLETHPGLYGTGSIFKHIVDTHREAECVIILSDDVSGFVYKFGEVWWIHHNTDSDHFRQAVQNTYQMASDLKTPLFGWGYDTSIMHHNQFNPFGFSGSIPASFIGLIPRLLGSANFDPRYIVGEDYDLCLQVKFYHRFFLLDLRYVILYKIWHNKGGCSTVRHSGVYDERNTLLKEKWGTNVIHVNPRKPQQVLVRTPF